MLFLLFNAYAQMIPHGYEPPETLKLFEKLRYTTGDGVSKTGDCDQALKAAMADLNERVVAKHDETLVAVWPKDGRAGWDPSTDAECILKKGKAKVVVEGLISRPGEGPQFPMIPPSRTLEIVRALYGDKGGSLVFTMAGKTFEAVDGKLAYTTSAGPPVEMQLGQRGASNGRLAAKALNEAILGTLPGVASRLEGVPEIQLVVVSAGVKVTRGGEPEPGKHKFEFRVGRQALLQYHRGKIGEKALVAKGKLFYQPGTDEQLVITVRPENIAQKK